MDEDPEYELTITHLCEDATDCEEPLRRAIEAALRQHRVSRARINVALVGDEIIAELNERHLSHTGPTDVLAFDLGCERSDDENATPARPPAGDATDQPTYAVDGELVLSVETARREASRRNHSANAELALYAVHGALHLLGYDDADSGSAAHMHEVEDQILCDVGIGAIYRTEPE
jgi:probable rRNA maturation factor